jgi:hypothetical protein
MAAFSIRRLVHVQKATALLARRRSGTEPAQAGCAAEMAAQDAARQDRDQALERGRSARCRREFIWCFCDKKLFQIVMALCLLASSLSLT